MLIDWFTVGAQALNFFILVWLMKRFLYKPIIHAIDEREKRIATELANADKKKAEAQKESDEFKHKNEEFDKQRATLLKKATAEVKDERQRLLEEARNAADALSAKRQETLRNDAHNLHQAISKRTQKEVFAIARRTLKDLASANLEASMSEMFTRRLRKMDNPAKAQLADAIKSASDPILVRSAFELPDEQRAAIQNALNETFSADIHVQFDTSPDFISGIELTTNGQKLAWSIDDYLTSMENGVDELLKKKNKIETKAKASTDLTTQITKRAYELYEKGGSKNDSAIRDWSQAEKEIRKVEPKSDAKAESKPETKKVESKPETKDDPKVEAKAEPKPEPKKIESKSEAGDKPKSESKEESKLETKDNPKVEAKAEPKSEAKVQSKSDTKTEPKSEAVPKPEKKNK
ncbi:MAG: F0F1 ATP synthase subunit delta [Woeseiaceae bacterium]|nr:F0F1 ATP synthase subunit delta [Woeseiaceae bacterium]